MRAQEPTKSSVASSSKVRLAILVKNNAHKNKNGRKTKKKSLNIIEFVHT